MSPSDLNYPAARQELLCKVPIAWENHSDLLRQTIRAEDADEAATRQIGEQQLASQQAAALAAETAEFTIRAELDAAWQNGPSIDQLGAMEQDPDPGVEPEPQDPVRLPIGGQQLA